MYRNKISECISLCLSIRLFVNVVSVPGSILSEKWLSPLVILYAKVVFAKCLSGFIFKTVLYSMRYALVLHVFRLRGTGPSRDFSRVSMPGGLCGPDAHTSVLFVSRLCKRSLLVGMIGCIFSR